MILSKQNIKTLETLGCVKYFEQIVIAQFKSATRLSLSKKVEQIYKEATKTEEKVNWSCNQCTYNFWRKVALLYYKSKEYYEAQDAEQEITPKPKKVGRTKKETKS